MRVCDWIASYLYDQGVRNVYGIMGGGAAGLNDGFIKHGGIRYVCFHHEQGAAHAATGESKMTGRIAVVNPTTGCGGTNCITAVLNAWQDGVPVVFISGNVPTAQCSRYINASRGIAIRKYGIQEHDIIETVSGMTKMALFVDNPENVEDALLIAIREATSGRPGPVWLDIPSDIQVAQMPKTRDDPDFSIGSPYTGMNLLLDKYQRWAPTVAKTLNDILHIMQTSDRPVIMAGQGLKQSKTVNDFKWFIEHFSVPYVSTYGARDLLPYDHPLNIGAVGIKGSRAGNFAMQASDAILVLGSSTNTSQIGYDPTMWAPRAKKMLVEIDDDECHKAIISWDLCLNTDLRHFFQAVKERTNDQK